jgi:uncharacterized protein VirK/YbjX
MPEGGEGVRTRDRNRILELPKKKEKKELAFLKKRKRKKYSK